MELQTEVLQNELLKMAKDLHDVCVNNSIRYYVIEGTALGACRHSGFIPWDDDIDIGMPREDYDKFCDIAAQILPDYLELRYYKTNEKSPFHFIKLVNNKTTLIEKKYRNYVEGIYIDIFPLDYLGEMNLARKVRCKLIWRLHTNIIFNCSTESAREKKLIRKIDFLLSKKMNLIRLHKKLERLMTKEKGDEACYLCNYLGAYNWIDIIPISYYGEPKLYDFEDIQLYGPAQIEKYLTHLYGNYLELPPVEKRINKHDYYYVDLSTPFDEYVWQ